MVLDEVVIVIFMLFYIGEEGDLSLNNWTDMNTFYPRIFRAKIGDIGPVVLAKISKVIKFNVILVILSPLGKGLFN